MPGAVTRGRTPSLGPLTHLFALRRNDGPLGAGAAFWALLRAARLIVTDSVACFWVT